MSTIFAFYTLFESHHMTYSQKVRYLNFKITSPNHADMNANFDVYEYMTALKLI